MLRVLMVTGAYYPEISGGGLQCREVVRALRGRAAFTILTTSTDATLPHQDEVGGVPVHRLRVNVDRFPSIRWAAGRLSWWFLRHQASFDVVHIHGFSRKSLPLTVFAKLFGKKVYLTLQTGGHDEPAAVRAKSRLLFWCYRQADLFSGVSPRLREAFCEAGLPAEKLWLIPNAADVERFHPVRPGQQRVLRRELGLPEDGPLVLFVGFFSQEKRPEVVFEAWARLVTEGVAAGTLVFVGATRSSYYEVDGQLAKAILERAQRLGVSHRVRFVEKTLEIERYYQAADVFVLSSIREGCPIALVEAMASGLACVATRLEGSTDSLIEDGINGLAVPPDAVSAFAAALRNVLTDSDRAQELGRRARQTIETSYSLARVAERYLEGLSLIHI